MLCVIKMVSLFKLKAGEARLERMRDYFNGAQVDICLPIKFNYDFARIRNVDRDQ
jgi:hypothetical protein